MTRMASDEHDNVIALSRFRADVARALAKRGKAWLDNTDLAHAMPTLDPLEAYFMVKELGVESATPLLTRASDEQLRTFVDLDCWESGDQPEMADLAAWLAPFAADGPESLRRAFLCLDNALQVLFVATNLTILDARSEDIPDTAEGSARMSTPDGFFVLDVAIDEESDLDPFAVISALYQHDPEDTYRVLMAAKWELASTLEEEARTFRAARLADMGFLERAEALTIFAPPTRSPTPRILAKPSVHAVSLPALYAGPFTEASLLTEALARVTDAAQLEAIEHELVYMVNAALIAYGGSPRDLRHAESIAERVRDTVSLGLEVLLDLPRPMEGGPGESHVAGATALLLRWHVRELFRHGNNASRALGRSARALIADPVVARWLEQGDADAPVADQLDRAFVRALSGLPCLSGGFDPSRVTRIKAFGSRREIEEAEARLDHLAERLI